MSAINIAARCPLCGHETDTAGRCPRGCATNFGGTTWVDPPTVWSEPLIANPSAEKLREVAALEKIAFLLESIDESLRCLASRAPLEE